MMTEKEILDSIKTKTFGKTIHTFESIDSTNTFAKRLGVQQGPHGTLIVADEQTAGRGRLQRQWISDKGKNLLFTLIVYPEFSQEKISLLPFVGSLAVCDAIETVTKLSAACKWPNDVLLNGKKVCGMLLESTTGTASDNKVILGIGVNVNQEVFPDELLHTASSLKNESGIEVDRVRLLTSIVEELENRYDQLAHFPPQRLLSDWKMKALLFGKKITVLEGAFRYTATAIDLAEDGSLIIETNDGRKKHIFAGDVSLAYN